MLILSIVAFILVFTLVVIVHEFGHLFVAKFFGIQVFEFSVGFGPKLFTRKIGGTFYSLHALPLGGFVRIAGLDDDKDQSKSQSIAKNSFNDKSPYIRALSVVAGPFMNFVLAAFFTAIIIGTIGIPFPTTTIRQVEPDSPAYRIGLKEGDKLIEVNHKPISSMADAIRTIHQSNGEPLVFTVERFSKQSNFTVKPFFDKNTSVWRIGFSPAFSRHHPPIYAVPFQAIGFTAQKSIEICTALFGLIMGKIPLSGLVGPIGIAYLSGQALVGGFAQFLGFASMLSVNLFVVNLLPIPALDGGRLFFILLEIVFGRPVLSPEAESRVHQFGIIFLLLLIALLSVKDLFHLPFSL